jgi:hypothetical protein
MPFISGGGGGGGSGSVDGWTVETFTWVYASATSFTIVGSDRTVVLSKGTRLKLTQTTVKYFVVSNSTFGGGNTTVTVASSSDYSLANAAITAPNYSYAQNPQGYPGWFNWAPATTGSSPVTDRARFAVSGKTCYCEYDSFGTSNATTKTFTLPCAVGASVVQSIPVPLGYTTDNGTTSASPGVFALPAGGGSSVSIFKTLTQGTGWTASGSWEANGEFFYEI